MGTGSSQCGQLGLLFDISRLFVFGHDSQTMSASNNRCTQEEILVAFSERLRSHVDLNEQNVIISDQPVPEKFPGGEMCIVIAPGPGQFPNWGAGHHATATENGQLVIGIYVINRRDRPGRAEAKVIGSPNAKRRSILQWKQVILQLCTVDDIAKGRASDAWIPTRAGRPILRDCPVPIRSTSPLDVPGHDSWIGLQITFSIVWDWNLYAQ
jgi:hypothetical protein